MAKKVRPIITEDYHKKCVMCNNIKHNKEFNKVKTNLDGFSSYCKPCLSKRNADYKNREKTKVCSICGETKAFSQFYDNRLSEDGKHHECKACCITQPIPTSTCYRKRRDLSHYNGYWAGQLGLPHPKNTGYKTNN